MVLTNNEKTLTTLAYFLSFYLTTIAINIKITITVINNINNFNTQLVFLLELKKPGLNVKRLNTALYKSLKNKTVL